MQRCCVEVAHRCLFDDAAAVHDEDPVSQSSYDPEIVGDPDDGGVESLSQILDNAHNLRLDGDIEGSGWLIGNDDFG